MRDLVLSVFIFGMLPFILTRPHWGVLMWTWVGLMSPHRLAWGFARDFPFAAVVGLAGIASLFISREPKRMPWSGPVVVLILLLFWMTITTPFALYPGDAWVQWQKVMKIQLFMFITLLVMQSQDRIKSLVWVTAASLAFYGVKGSLYTLRGGSNMVLGPDGSFIEGNTEIALALTMVVPLLRWLQLNTENKWLRWGLIVSMLLCAVAIIGSYSRGGFLAITAMGAFLWLKSPKKLVSGVLIAVFAPAVLAFMPDKWWDKMSTIQTYDEDNSAMGRINAWYFARNLAWDRPFVGGGFEAFSPESFLIWAPNPTHFQDAHSIWFEILGEHGYVGLMLYMLLWLLSWRTATKIARAAKGRPELTWASTLARMIQVSFIGYWVGGSFLGLAYWDFPYLLMVILVLTQTVVKREVAASGEVMSAVSHGPAPHPQPRAIRPAASPHAAGRP